MTALFGKKEEKMKENQVQADTATEPSVSQVESVSTPLSVVDGQENIARVLAHPRITEKATGGIEKGVYVFDVAVDANKKQIKEAVKAMYKVDPVKVHVTTIATKKVRNMRTGIKGTKSGGKKAYVYLKKGDTISIM